MTRKSNKKDAAGQDPIKQAVELARHNLSAMKKRKSKRPPKNKPGTYKGSFTPKRQQRYCDALKEHGEQALAAQEVGVTYATVQHYRKQNDAFREREDEAMRIYRAGLAAEVHRRGVDGIQEPIYWNGAVVGWITKYSDRLLELHIKRHTPEYRDKYTVTQEHTGAVEIMSDLSKLPKQMRDELRSMLEKVNRHIKEQDGE